MGSKRSFALPSYNWDTEPPVRPGPEGRYSTTRQGQEEFDRWEM